MLYDHNGRQIRIGQTHIDYVWNCLDGMLPAWLTTVGVMPIVTFGSAATDGGSATFQTKVAAPATEDIAGIQTASLNMAAFSEISFSVMGISNDVGASSTNQALQMGLLDSGSTGGAIFQSNVGNAGASQTRVLTDAAIDNNYGICDAINLTHRKSLGMVLRPSTKEVFFTAGDPDDGAGVVGYSRAVLNSVTAPLFFQVRTKTAAQRAMTIQKVHLRLSFF